jgi:hypothetical protein
MFFHVPEDFILLSCLINIALGDNLRQLDKIIIHTTVIYRTTKLESTLIKYVQFIWFIHNKLWVITMKIG